MTSHVNWSMVARQYTACTDTFGSHSGDRSIFRASCYRINNVPRLYIAIKFFKYNSDNDAFVFIIHLINFIVSNYCIYLLFYVVKFMIRLCEEIPGFS